jgi:hypothetical protein
VYNLSHIAGVAQLVEQLICNQPVAGSSPISSSKYEKPRYENNGAFFVLALGLLLANNHATITFQVWIKIQELAK